MILTETEVEQRITLLRRFRSMLEEQRSKFKNYLSILDVQEQAVAQGDTEKVTLHAEMEQAILNEILSMQKVIDPLQEMYHYNFPGGDKEITELQESLGRLQDQVLQRNEQTRAFLQRKKAELQNRIAALRIPRNQNSMYSAKGHATLLDIRA